MITGVNIMEVPEVVRWLRGGELLFTAGFAFKDSPEVRLSLPQALKDKGVAALAIKPGQYLSAIPGDIIERCEQLSLPLIELPPDLPYMDVMLPIIEIIISDQLQRLKKSEEIHRRLLEALLSGEGMEGIARSLAALTGHPVVILDQYFLPVGASGLDLVPEEGLGLEWCPEAGKYAVRVKWREEGREGVAVPARVGRLTAGYVVVLERAGHLDEQDLMAAEQASTAAALEFAKEQAVAEAERRVAGELVEEVISGRFPSEEAIVARARALGLNLRRPLRVFLVELELPVPGPAPGVPARELLDSGESRLLGLVRGALSRFPGAAVAATRSGSVVGLAQFREKDEVSVLSGLLEEAVTEARRFLAGVGMAAGVGRSCGLAEAAESYHDAVTALRIGRLLGQAGGVTVIDDLGPYAFLAEVRSSRALLDFYRKTVGRVVDHDLETGGGLARTLQAYFESRGSVETAARALFVHKNSVLYRLRRVEALTGLRLQDARDRFHLELALRVAPLVDPRFCSLVAPRNGGGPNR